MRMLGFRLTENVLCDYTEPEQYCVLCAVGINKFMS
jgi:hypothetical protein